MPPTGEANAKLQDALAALLEAEERGERIDADAWTARYPDVADELRAFLANRARFEALAGKRALVHEVFAPTIAPGGAVAPAAGARVRYFGDYELLDEIARGGMGVVYRARQATLNRVVALKMILAGQFAGPADVQRFRREAEAAAALDHPNIIPIYEVGEHEGQQYFTMKLVEGGSLATALGRPEWKPGPKEQQRRAAALVAAVARAVHHAHQRGILHRDLKPANVLLGANSQQPLAKSEEGQTKLPPDGYSLMAIGSLTPLVTDFGLAKQQGEKAGQEPTRTGAILGTPAYMPPEQAKAQKQLTTAADVYSLGAILYATLTGQPPFQGETTYDVLVKVIDQEPTPPLQLVPTLDPDLATICMKCLAKEPAKRYASAEALAEELERWLKGIPILARPFSRSERLRRWCKRNPVVAGLGFTLAVTIVAFIAGSTLAVRQILIEKDEGTQRLARFYVEKGMAQIEEERPLGALPWLLEALRIDGAHPVRTPLHRERVAAVLRQTPRVVRFWEGAKLAEFRPTGNQLFTATGDRLEQWDWPAGKSVGEPARLPGEIEFAFYGEGGKLIVCQTKSHFALVEAGTGRLVYPPVPLPKPIREAADFARPLLSADGQRLVVSNSTAINREIYQTNLRLLEAATGQPIGKEFQHVTFDMGIVQPSPCGRFVVTTNAERTPNKDDQYDLTLWDLAAGQPIWKHRFRGGYASAVAFRPDGARLVAGNGKEIELFEVATGKKLPSKPAILVRGDRHALWNLTWSADGSRIAAGFSNDSVDLLDGEDLSLVEGRTLEHGSYPVFSPRRPRLFTRRYGSSYSRDRGSVKSWNARDASSERADFHLPGYFGELFFSADDELIGVTSGKVVRVFAAADGKPQTPPMPHQAVDSQGFSPDGRYLLTAGAGARLWDLARGLDGFSMLPDCAVDPALSGDFAAGGAVVAHLHPQGRLEVWDAKSQAARWFAVEPDWTELRLDPTGQFVLLMKQARDAAEAKQSPSLNRLKIISTASGQAASPHPLPFAEIFKVRFTPDGQRALIVERHLNEGREKEAYTQVHTLELATGRLQGGVKLETKYADSVALSADGRWLAVACRTWRSGPQGQEPVWFEEVQVRAVGDAGPPAFRHELPDVPSDLTFSPDGARLALAFGNAPLEVWTWRQNEKLPGDFRHPVRDQREPFQHPTQVAFSPDGRTLVTAVSRPTGGESALRLWESATGQPKTPYLRHGGFVQSIAFRPDGVAFAAGGNGEMRLYETATGLPLGPPIVTPNIADATWDAAGQHLLICSNGGSREEANASVLRWRLPEAKAPEAELSALGAFLAQETLDATGGLNLEGEAASAAAWRRGGAALASGAASADEPEPERLRRWRRRRLELAISHSDWAAARPFAAAQTADLPNSWRAHQQFGLVLAALGEFAAAEQELTKALEHGGTIDLLRQRRGEVRAELRKWQEAADDFAPVAGADFDFIRAAFMAGRHAEASERALALLPRDAGDAKSVAAWELYPYLLLTEPTPRPFAWFAAYARKQLKDWAHIVEQQLFLALALSRVGEHAEAKAAAEEGVRLAGERARDKDQAEAQAVLACVLAHAGDAEGARKALAAVPPSPSAPHAWEELKAPGTTELHAWRSQALLATLRGAAEAKLKALSEPKPSAQPPPAP